MGTTYKESLSDELFTSPVAYTVTSTAIECDQIDSIGIVASATAVTMAAVAYASATEINATTNVLTKAHSFVTGSVVQVATSTTLPSGLTAVTDYYVIKVSATQIKLAANLADALAGTAVPLVDTGTGNQTVTASTTGTCDLSILVSIDGSIYVPYAAAASLAVAGSITGVDRPKFNYFKVKLALTDNQFQVSCKYLLKDFNNGLK